MRCLFSQFAALLLWASTYAQLPQRSPLTVKLPSNVFFNEFTGKPFFPGESGINGSPFFNKDWKRCLIKLNDGRYFEEVPIKLNIFNQTIHYLSVRGAEMEVTPGLVTAAQIIDTAVNGETTVRHFYSGFKPIGNNDGQTFYEALAEGKASLLLCRKVRIVEIKVVGLATQKEYQLSEEYYISLDSNIVKCKKSASFFIELFADKKEEVKKYIDDQNLKFRSEKDYRRIVSYYNSL